MTYSADKILERLNTIEDEIDVLKHLIYLLEDEQEHLLEELKEIQERDRLALETMIKGKEILKKVDSLLDSTDELLFYADPSTIKEYSNEELDEILEFLTLQVELVDRFKKDIPIKSNLLKDKGDFNRTL